MISVKQKDFEGFSWSSTLVHEYKSAWFHRDTQLDQKDYTSGLELLLFLSFLEKMLKGFVNAMNFQTKDYVMLINFV